ncbi:centromere protein Chl4/mis15/CENP-N [Geopyxis carbonaria]|nr:centromere protein Chl4/mis15/CENP-N [Geopyxis carbonaria]
MPPKRPRRSTIAAPSHPTPYPHSTILPLTPQTKTLITRLPKATLTRLAARWLSPKHTSIFQPTLTDPSDDDTELSLEEAAGVYVDLAASKTARAKDVAARLLTHEFRHGLSLLAVAEAEWEHLLAKSTAKWTAWALIPAGSAASAATPQRPRFHAATFLTQLAASVRPAFTPHFASWRHPAQPLTVLRVALHDAAAPPAWPQRRHVFFLALPDGSDHVFTTLGTADAALLAGVKTGVAAGLSREGCRLSVASGRVVAKTLDAMCALRGAGAGAGGMLAGWGVYADGFEADPLAPPREMAVAKTPEGERAAKRRKKMVAARFGATAADDGKALESVFFVLEDRFPAPPPRNPPRADDDSDDDDGGADWRPKVSVLFEGSHVFAGIRELAEIDAGEEEGGRKPVVRLESLAGWMTGEEGVSSGFVRDGRVKRGDCVRFSGGTVGGRRKG